MTKIVQTVDNFDKAVIATETVVLVVFGIAYTLDLGPQNFERAKEDFGKYIAVADRVGPATVTVTTDGSSEVILKPRAKNLKPKRAPSTNGHEPEQHALSTVIQSNQLKLDSEPVAEAPALVLKHAPPPDDEFPPNKSYLRMSTDERGGPGSKALQLKRRDWRHHMREWLRYNGYPTLQPKGVVPQKGIDDYWQYVERVRAGRANSA